MKMILPGRNDMPKELLILMMFAIALVYAAVWDYMYRIIPDTVPITLSVLGLLCVIFLSKDNALYAPFAERVVGLLLPAITLLLIYHFDKRIGGGDFKMLSTMGFSLGIYALIPILIVASFSAVIWSNWTKQRSVPLAVFLFIGFAAYVFIMISGGVL